ANLYQEVVAGSLVELQCADSKRLEKRDQRLLYHWLKASNRTRVLSPLTSLHRRRRRFYAARRSEVRASEPFLLFSSSFPTSTRWFVGIDDFRIRCACGSGY